MCESYVQPYSKPCSSASRMSSTKRECGGSGRTVTPKVSTNSSSDGSQILGGIGERADDLDEVGLVHPVREPDPLACGRTRRLRGEHLDHRNAVAAEEGGLVSSKEAAAEDHSDVGLRDAVLERPTARVDLKPGVFKERRQLRLAGGEQEDALLAVSLHAGILPGPRAFEAVVHGYFWGYEGRVARPRGALGRRSRRAGRLPGRPAGHARDRADGRIHPRRRRRA